MVFRCFLPDHSSSEAVCKSTEQLQPCRASALDSSAEFYRKHDGLHVAAEVFGSSSLNVDERFRNRYRALVNEAQLNLQTIRPVMIELCSHSPALKLCSHTYIFFSHFA